MNSQTIKLIQSDFVKHIHREIVEKNEIEKKTVHSK